MSSEKLKEASNIGKQEITRLIIVGGDKGGVGKSVTAQALIDYLRRRGVPVAAIDADTRNPDVERMFSQSGDVKCLLSNLRSKAGGWMDVMDFIMDNIGYTIVMNTPAGAGEYLAQDIPPIAKFMAEMETPSEMELWWTMNHGHDSFNLLEVAHSEYSNHFKRICVVCNLFFTDGNRTPYFKWQESNLKKVIEKKGGSTIYLPGLHGRVTDKLFNPKTILPFSDAIDAAIGEQLDFMHSERVKLKQWVDDVEVIFDPLFEGMY